MDSSSSIIRFLAGVPQFSAMDPGQLSASTALRRSRCWPRVRLATVAGGAVDELRIVVSGRLAEHGGGRDARVRTRGGDRRGLLFRPAPGIGDPDRFARDGASDPFVGRHHSGVSRLSRTYRSMFRGVFQDWRNRPAPQSPPALSCAPPARKGRLDAAVKDAFVSALEELGGGQNPAPGKLWLTCPRRA